MVSTLRGLRERSLSPGPPDSKPVSFLDLVLPGAKGEEKTQRQERSAQETGSLTR